MGDRIKGCPFCGDQPEIEEIEPDCWDIGCRGCGYSLLSGRVGLGYFDTREEAITTWGTRHDQ